MTDQITEISLVNVRSLSSVTVRPRGLSVVLGENGVGKSAIVESLELLRKASQQNFIDELSRVHGGPRAILRKGSTQMVLEVAIGGRSTHGDPGTIVYTVVLHAAPGRDTFVLLDEQLTENGTNVIFRADNMRGFMRGPGQPRNGIGPTDRDTLLALAGRFEPAGSAPARIFEALQSIDVHVPFSIGPLWGKRERQQPSPMRESRPMLSGEALNRHGDNLAAAYQELKNGAGDWQEVRHWIRQGLGDGVSDLNVKLDGTGGGSVALKYGGLGEEVRADGLSDGTLAWLGHVALVSLAKRRRPSIVAFDEPEAHLHPRLQATLVDLYQSLAEVCPVMLFTQSDRIVDALSAPGESTLLCTLSEDHKTQLLRPDRAALDKWFQRRRFADLRHDRLEADYFVAEGDNGAKGPP